MKDIISFDKRVNPQNTSTETKPDLPLEIAHILLIDVVGYSKLLVNEQIELLRELNQIVRSTECFRAAESTGKLTRVPTGDGMALLFFRSPEQPAQCALEISQALKDYPHIQLRMGVHSGPVNEVTDVNDRTNIAGAGINVAQRVMECGDAGHILLSAHVAEDLAEYRHWRPHLHDLGECEVKYGLRLHLVNLYKDNLGNPHLPEKLKRGKTWKQAAVPVRPIGAPRWSKSVLLIAILVSTVALVISSLIFFNRAPTTATRAPAPGATAASALAAFPEKSIAVLPFENLSEEKANAYFADGIQEEILTRLAKIADLKVISRTSTQRYQSKPGNLAEIAKQLGVAHILEGRVQKVANQVRVNVQLINAQTDSHLWAETYDRKLTDIFEVESEIARGIAAALEVKLTESEEQALTVKPTNNPKAYDAYLRGLAVQARSSYSIDLVGKAIGFYEQAVQLDSNFALAWARLSRAHALVYSIRADTTAARRDAAKNALQNAQKLQRSSPETLLALGYYQYLVLRDYELAKTTFRLVSKMLPGSSEVPSALAGVTRREGNWDESVAYLEQGLALDPRNAELLNGAAWIYVILRQFPAALRLFDRTLDVLPDEPNLLAMKARVYLADGKPQEAANLLSAVNAQTPSEITFLIKITQLRLERNYAETIQLLQTRQAQFQFASEIDKGINELWLALALRVAGDAVGAKVAAERARNTLEPFSKSQPDNFLLAAALCLTNATVGDKDSALKEYDRTTALLANAKDRVHEPTPREILALIEMIFGENNRAISTLTQLLETPYSGWFYYATPVTPALLRLDPIWDPLRSDPSFQKLCEEKQL
jgi:TolB-like protein/class 3 adenylate cyclase/Tfp pilus assembly protein PilF